ncbi:MAG: hypothetical protein PUF03_06070 [Lachnospiraceae bacterium]|nr:hypothetical protein [Lachnospiraceae bacterium]MDD6627800.1 hypothetical protein [Lachnospiraceae bacterium]
MDGNNMYPNQNDITGQEQNQQSTEQTNQNNYQDNTGYQSNTYQNTGYNGDYTGSNYQNYNNYNNYQPYQQMNPYHDSQLELEEPVKIGEWVLALVLMMIPCVNIIMMFVFAFSKTEKKSKSNFFKAYLIFYAIMLALVFLFWIAIIFIAAVMS